MKKVHIVTYTHWDREFRWEFERTRMRLVDLFDHLPEIMKEKPDYCSLLCDSQHTLIFDYLEIRPEMELVEVIYKKEHFMDAVIKDKAKVISKELYKLTKNTILEIQELKYLPKNMCRSL